MKRRQVLHVDMDAFYASVEQRDDPGLRGKPVVVGGGSNRGVVAAASYESRSYGIRSAMPMREALRRCPQLIRVRPRMKHYQAVSRQVFAVFREFTPDVEGLSLDEAFLDVSGSLGLFGGGEEIALAIKRRIREDTSLTASVGVASNKFVAKIASDLDKPDGLVVVTDANLRQTLDPLSVRVIPGIGRVTSAKLEAVGIQRIADLRLAPMSALEGVFGRYAKRMRDRASGLDDRPVVADRRDKSISAEETFETDIGERSELLTELLKLSERTASRIRAQGIEAATVQVKIRQADFTTFTRQQKMSPPTASTDAIYRAAVRLLDGWMSEHPGERVRLLGVGGSSFARSRQQDLFGAADGAQPARIDQTVDEVRSRFGSTALKRARNLKRDQIR